MHAPPYHDVMDQTAAIDTHPADRRSGGAAGPSLPHAPGRASVNALGKRLIISGALLLAVVVPLALVLGQGGTSVAQRVAAGARSGNQDRASSPVAVAGTGVLSWRILRSYTARQIPNAYVPAKARGTYLIMEVSAVNTSAHPIALQTSLLDLRLGGTSQRLDAAALSALELAGHKGLSTTDLAPNEAAAGWVVFDVAPRLAGSKPVLGLSLGS